MTKAPSMPAEGLKWPAAWEPAEGCSRVGGGAKLPGVRRGSVALGDGAAFRSQGYGGSKRDGVSDPPKTYSALTHRRCRWAHRADSQLPSTLRHQVALLTLNRFVADQNADPKPFTWTADPDRIIAAVKRGHQVLDSIH